MKEVNMKCFALMTFLLILPIENLSEPSLKRISSEKFRLGLSKRKKNQIFRKSDILNKQISEDSVLKLPNKQRILEVQMSEEGENEH